MGEKEENFPLPKTKCDDMISFENSNKFEFNEVENQLKENLKFSLNLRIEFGKEEIR